MAEVAKERATALRRSLKQEKKQHRKAPSLSEAETFFLRGLLLDDNHAEPKDSAAPVSAKQEGDTSNNNVPRGLNDEVLFSLPPPSNLPEQKTELPAHHKPAKRWSTRGLWKAHEEGFLPNILKKAVNAAEEEGKEMTENEGKGGDHTEQTDDIEDYDEIASDVEVRRDSRSDVSDASSWDENDHQDTYDTWEVRRRCHVLETK